MLLCSWGAFLWSPHLSMTGLCQPVWFFFSLLPLWPLSLFWLGAGFCHHFLPFPAGRTTPLFEREMMLGLLELLIGCRSPWCFFVMTSPLGCKRIEQPLLCQSLIWEFSISSSFTLCIPLPFPVLLSYRESQPTKKITQRCSVKCPPSTSGEGKVTLCPIQTWAVTCSQAVAYLLFFSRLLVQNQQKK